MNVSLVYNNKKLIGKCSKFAIQKVQGTSPFVMLENFEPKQPQLNENQKLLLEDLKNIKESHEDKNMLGLIWVLGQRFTTVSNIKTFTDQEILQVLQTLEQEEE